MPASRPEDLHELFMAGVNAHDLDALMEVYEPDPVSVGLDGQPLGGTAAVRELLGGFLQRAQRLETKTRKVFVNGDIALMSSIWSLVMANPDGSTRTSEGMSAEVARRQPDGTWLWIIDDPAFTR